MAKALYEALGERGPRSLRQAAHVSEERRNDHPGEDRPKQGMDLSGESAKGPGVKEDCAREVNGASSSSEGRPF